MPAKRSLQGNKHGRLHVISRAYISNKKDMWLCYCDCGGFKIARGTSLVVGIIKSCGCLRSESSKRNAAKRVYRGYRKDLSGEKFGRLTVLKYSHSKNKRSYWLCVCDCGKIKTASGRNLSDGGTKSCGCLTVEGNNYKHGHALAGNQTPEYKTWSKIKERCFVESDHAYKYYGGRGITMCRKWDESFDEFFKYIGNKPEGDYSIDRINNNKNYEPGNVRWATKEQQANNTRKNVYIEYGGITKTMSQWSKIEGMLPGTLRKRLDMGWSISKSIETPVRKHKPYSRHN